MPGVLFARKRKKSKDILTEWREPKTRRTKFITPDHPRYNRWRGHMQPRDRLIWDIMAASGLRISDAISLTRDQLQGGAPVIARKTGKPLMLQLEPALIDRALRYMRPSDVYVFASRDDRRKGKPISRQAVEYQYRQIAQDLHLDGINAHSARKLYAWDLYQRTGDVQAVQRALQHAHLSTTCLYLLSDRLTA